LPTNTKYEKAVYTLDGKLIKTINHELKIETIDIFDKASGFYLLISIGKFYAPWGECN